ncbi:MAG: outer membrane lipoprotein-sorting protein [Vicinamibacterales bacterium]
MLGRSLIVTFMLAASLAAQGQDDPRAIIEEVQKRGNVQSQRYDGLLQVFGTEGAISDKQWTLERLGSYGDSRVVLSFNAPAEVKGVALLVVNHPDRASDQWMWTPAIERDRRIALQDRSTRFFGTDFSFEDLEERDVDQFDYELLGEETVGGSACWRIESTPRQSKSSQYTRSMVWVRKDTYTLARIESYIREELVRRLDYTNLEQVQGIWTARQLEMHDLRRGSRTRLTLQNLQYNVPMNADDFTLQALRRR